MKATHIKLFSESPIIVNRVRSLLQEQGIGSLVKNQIESARLAGFGVSLDTVDLFILSSDLEKANKVLITFKKDINS
mgnify:FL=1|tara:strand:- start:468 stop:698 length:231 start_codon:yes stop_codon:yes gene_type:complete